MEREEKQTGLWSSPRPSSFSCSPEALRDSCGAGSPPVNFQYYWLASHSITVHYHKAGTYLFMWHIGQGDLHLYNFMVITTGITCGNLASWVRCILPLRISHWRHVSCGLLKKSYYVRDLVLHSWWIERREPWWYQESSLIFIFLAGEDVAVQVCPVLMPGGREGTWKRCVCFSRGHRPREGPGVYQAGLTTVKDD